MSATNNQQVPQTQNQPQDSATTKFVKAAFLSQLDPPGISLSIGGILQILSSLSPVLLSWFFIISSLSNGNLKWVMYLAGFVVLLFIFSVAAFTTNAKFENMNSRSSPYWKQQCNFVSPIRSQSIHNSQFQ